VLLCVELSSQKEQTVSKLREAREEKLSSRYFSHDEQLTSFFDSCSRFKNLNEMVEVIDLLKYSLLYIYLASFFCGRFYLIHL